MLLPNNERAIAESGKVRDYLLSVDHPRGCYKSVFFRAIGYSQARWQKLRGDLADIASKNQCGGQTGRYSVRREVRRRWYSAVCKR